METAQIAEDFPILERLSVYLSNQKNLSGLAVGWHCHLTALTSRAARALLEAGGKLMLSECNADTTDPQAVEEMRNMGASVYLGAGSCQAVLEQKPAILSDTGADLICAYLQGNQYELIGSCEITTSGITRLRALGGLPLPVININDGRLKSLIENFHGVGDGLVEALHRLTSKNWSQARASVVGYGKVGAGVAHYLRQAGLSVSVVENDPVRSLAAWYDGFTPTSLCQALEQSELLVTATGSAKLLSEPEWDLAGDGLHVFNVGHWAQEIDLQALKLACKSHRAFGCQLEEYILPGKNGTVERKVYLAAQGGPVNVVLLTGSPQPTLIHLATELLCWDFMAAVKRAGQKMTSGEMPVPEQVEILASTLALQTLGFIN